MRVSPVIIVAVALAVAVAAAVAYWALEDSVSLEDLGIVDMAPAFTPEDGAKPRTKPPKLIVIHHSATATPAATRAALRNGNNSTHFEVDKDGKIYRYLDPTTTTARHAGANWANAYGIGIDVTHVTNAPWPPAQVAAVGRLVRALCHEFGIAGGVVPDGVLYTGLEQLPEGAGIVRHRNVRVGGTVCPQDFPMQALGPVMAKGALA